VSEKSPPLSAPSDAENRARLVPRLVEGDLDSSIADAPFSCWVELLGGLTEVMWTNVWTTAANAL
jgi:hypothetical protein